MIATLFLAVSLVLGSLAAVVEIWNPAWMRDHIGGQRRHASKVRNVGDSFMFAFAMWPLIVIGMAVLDLDGSP